MTQSQQLADLAGLWLDPLTDEELNQLSEFFERLHDAIDSMNLSMIDGFFTALVLSLNSELPEDWLELVVVDIDAFSKIPDHATVVEWLFRHYQNIKYHLNAISTPSFEPIFLYHEDYEQAWVSDWCYGFVQGVQCDLDSWQSLSDVFPMLELITAMSTLPPPSEPLLGWQDDLSEDDKLFYETQQVAVRALEEYHKAVDPIAGWDAFLELLILTIHDYMLDPNHLMLDDDSDSMDDQETDNEAFIQSTTLSAVYEPSEIAVICPCGSGKAFSVCCGIANRLLH